MNQIKISDLENLNDLKGEPFKIECEVIKFTKMYRNDA